MSESMPKEELQKFVDLFNINRMIHDLKTVSPYFEAVKDGSKAFECRRNDRNFQVGDLLLLRHYNPHGDWRDGTLYSGRALLRLVTYVLKDFEGLAPGYVVLGIAPVRLEMARGADV